MSVSQVPPDGGIGPLKDQQMEQVAKAIKPGGEKEETKVGGDSVELSERAKLFQEIEQYKKALETIPSPNEGRIQELKESIANGTFITDKAIRETAQKLADQMLGI